MVDFWVVYSTRHWEVKVMKVAELEFLNWCSVPHFWLFLGLAWDILSLFCPLFLSSSTCSFLSHPPAHTRLLLITITSHKFLITTLLVTVSTACPRFFLSLVACSAGRSPVLAAIPHHREREREEGARARFDRGRETSLAAVIGQEVGCLDVRALLSLPLPSQWAVSCVFASICSPVSLSPSFLSVSLFIWTDLIEGWTTDRAALTRAPHLPLWGFFKTIHVVWNFSHAWTWI